MNLVLIAANRQKFGFGHYERTKLLYKILKNKNRINIINKEFNYLIKNNNKYNFNSLSIYNKVIFYEALSEQHTLEFLINKKVDLNKTTLIVDFPFSNIRYIHKFQ